MNWYADILGLKCYQFTPGKVAFMTADADQSHEITLIELGDDAPGPEKGQIGLNHFAYVMESLDDLKEWYVRANDMEVPIDFIADHGISIGIYINDPDGNGIEVTYEMPRSQWPKKHDIFYSEGVNRGRFPGPWDEVPAHNPR